MPTIYEQLILHEGIRLTVYNDSKGIPTIGVGRNLHDKGLNKEEVAMLLKNDVEAVESQLSKYPWYAKLDYVRQKVLIDMGFNLGVPGLLKFKKMIQALQQKDYAKAAAEMKDSRWYAEVKKRGERLVKMMLTGEDYRN